MDNESGDSEKDEFALTGGTRTVSGILIDNCCHMFRTVPEASNRLGE